MAIYTAAFAVCLLSPWTSWGASCWPQAWTPSCAWDHKAVRWGWGSRKHQQTLEGVGVGHRMEEALQVAVAGLGSQVKEGAVAAEEEEVGESASQVLKAQLEAQHGLGKWTQQQGLSQTAKKGKMEVNGKNKEGLYYI